MTNMTYDEAIKLAIYTVLSHSSAKFLTDRSRATLGEYPAWPKNTWLWALLSVEYQIPESQGFRAALHLRSEHKETVMEGGFEYSMVACWPEFNYSTFTSRNFNNIVSFNHLTGLLTELAGDLQALFDGVLVKCLESTPEEIVQKTQDQAIRNLRGYIVNQSARMRVGNVRTLGGNFSFLGNGVYTVEMADTKSYKVTKQLDSVVFERIS